MSKVNGSLPDLTSASQLRNVGLKREQVTVEDWGMNVWVWELTGEEWDHHQKAFVKTKGGKVVGLDLAGQTARLLMYAIKDPQGNRIFSHQDELLRMPAGGLNQLAEVARRLSRLEDEDAEEMEENFDVIPHEPSSSDSLAISAIEASTSS